VMSAEEFPHDVLIVEEVAKLLHCSRDRVYELIYSRRLHAVRPGRRFIVPKRSLIAYLAGDQIRPMDSK
jgi:excisionase family DNA binding protein